MLTDYYFWFTQPSSVLSRVDFIFGFVAAGLLVLGIILWIAQRFVKNAVLKKVLNRFQIKIFTVAVLGLVWFGFRYENVPIFARRFWGGLVILIDLVWLLFILKYLIFEFRKEKSEYTREQLKNKYLRR